MAQEFTHDDLREILTERIGVDESDLSGDGSQTFDEIGLDSLAIIGIQLEVQQRYGIDVPPEDAEGIRTLDEAVDYVNRRLEEA